MTVADCALIGACHKSVPLVALKKHHSMPRSTICPEIEGTHTVQELAMPEKQ